MKHDSTLIRPGTLAEQVTAWCEARRTDIGAMTTDSPADIDTDELAVIWDQLDTLKRELEVWIRDLAVELGRRMPKPADDTERPSIEHPTLGRIEGHKSQKIEWNGLAVLAGLSQPVVDGDGVILDAVPTEILERVLPAIKGTSSKWNVSKMPERLRKHRTVTYGPTLPRRV